MVHIAESTLGRRYAGWFIRNTEHAQRVLEGLRSLPLPKPKASAIKPGELVPPTGGSTTTQRSTTSSKVAWGKVTV